jgi:hypothetical protein
VQSTTSYLNRLTPMESTEGPAPFALMPMILRICTGGGLLEPGSWPPPPDGPANGR